MQCGHTELATHRTKAGPLLHIESRGTQCPSPQGAGYLRHVDYRNNWVFPGYREYRLDENTRYFRGAEILRLSLVRTPNLAPSSLAHSYLHFCEIDHFGENCFVFRLNAVGKSVHDSRVNQCWGPYNSVPKSAMQG